MTAGDSPTDKRRAEWRRRQRERYQRVKRGLRQMTIEVDPEKAGRFATRMNWLPRSQAHDFIKVTAVFEVHLNEIIEKSSRREGNNLRLAKEIASVPAPMENRHGSDQT